MVIFHSNPERHLIVVPSQQNINLMKNFVEIWREKNDLYNTNLNEYRHREYRNAAIKDDQLAQHNR